MTTDGEIHDRKLFPSLISLSEAIFLALAEYQRALENYLTPGVVGDALHNLKLIQAAGIEGLEPVFKLLEGVEE